MASSVDSHRIVDEHCLRHLGTRLPLARILVEPSIRKQLDGALASIHDAETSTSILGKLEAQILAAHLDAIIAEFEAYLYGAGTLDIKTCREAIPDSDRLTLLDEEDTYIFLAVNIHCAIHYLLRASYLACSKDEDKVEAGNKVESAWAKARDLVRKGERIEESEKITDLRAQGLRILKLCAREAVELRMKEMAIKASEIERVLPAKSLLASMKKRSISVVADLDTLWQKGLSQPSQEILIPETGDTETQPPETLDPYININMQEEEEPLPEPEENLNLDSFQGENGANPAREVSTAPEPEQPLAGDEGDTIASRKRKRSIILEPTEPNAAHGTPVSKIRRRNDSANLAGPGSDDTDSDVSSRIKHTPIRGRGFKEIRIHGTPQPKKLLTGTSSPSKYLKLTRTRDSPQIQRTYKTTGGKFSSIEDEQLKNGLRMYGWSEWSAISLGYFQDAINGLWKTPEQVRNRARYLETRGLLIAKDYPTSNSVTRYGPRSSGLLVTGNNSNNNSIRKKLNESFVDDDAIEAFDDTQEEVGNRNGAGSTNASKGNNNNNGRRRKSRPGIERPSKRAVLEKQILPDVETESEEDEPQELRRSARNNSNNNSSSPKKGATNKTEEMSRERGEESEERRPLRRSTRHKSSQKEKEDVNNNNIGQVEKEIITLRRSTRRAAHS